MAELDPLNCSEKHSKIGEHVDVQTPNAPHKQHKQADSGCMITLAINCAKYLFHWTQLLFFLRSTQFNSQCQHCTYDRQILTNIFEINSIWLQVLPMNSICLCECVDAYAIGCGVLATIEQWYPTRKFNGTMVPHKRNSKVWPGLVTKEKTIKYPTSAMCTV